MDRPTDRYERLKRPFSWRDYINIPLLLLWLVGFGIFFGGMPKYGDDYWYMAGLKPWFEAQGVTNPDDGGNILTNGIPFAEITEIWKSHYQSDNFRLPNLIVPFFLLLPKWVGGTFICILLGWITALTVRISGYSWRKSPITGLAIFIITFYFPWRDSFGQQVFQFNYIISCWLGIVLFYWLRIRRNDWIGLTATFALGFITGWSHEGIATPVVAGLLTIFLFCKSWRRTDVALAMVGICIAVCMLLNAPHTSTAAVEKLDIASKSMWENLVCIFPIQTPVYFVMLVGIAAMIAYGRARKVLTNPTILFCLISASTGILLTVISDTYGRMAIWGVLASLIGVLTLIRLTTARLFNSYRVVSGAAVAILIATVYTHLTFVDIYTLKFRQYKHEVVDKHPEKWISGFFDDTSTVTDLPVACLNLPQRYFYSAATISLLEYHKELAVQLPPGTDLTNPSSVIPLELEYVDSIAGESAGRGSSIKKLNRYLFTTENACPPGAAVDGYVDLGKGPVKTSFTMYSFTSRKDNKRYYLLDPTLNWYLRNFKTIKGAWLQSDQPEVNNR